MDRFAGTLQGLRERIPYLQELGLTYLHLMPLYRTPANSDGGFAVSSFREVNPALGSMADLADLARELRQHGISLVLDLVFNHTSDEHEWALKARAGDKTYQDYYLMFDDRTLPDQYQRTLREIFPEQAPGSFTYIDEMQKWVWTTFFPFQWDLNYSNPAVLRAILGELLFLANQGAEVLRLDAVPFIWKALGTPSENLPQVHWIIQALNAAAQIAAPALLFKSEAIVHPRDVRSYIGPNECQISYNPIMMVSLWEALATRQTRFFAHTMRTQFPLEPGTTWVNYIRSHDDIGWGFADEDAAEVGINGFDHRLFLNMFYTGRFPGSFAKGLPFNHNPNTGDMRISGTMASLAGLEQALAKDNALYEEHAIKRILLIYSIILSAGGIPLIYLGDELATLNDYTFTGDDNRLAHRPCYDWSAWEQRQAVQTPAGRVYTAIRHMIEVRKRTPRLRNGATQFLDSGNGHVLAFSRHDQLLVLANFSEAAQQLDSHHLPLATLRLRDAHDLITARSCPLAGKITLEPYQFVWLVNAG
ncbi:MAG: DUF3459 domain-containing protein [Chloroflexi bacterium]|nr:DUF3459 domain-containing protein [Chloroflexota bacterium]